MTKISLIYDAVLSALQIQANGFSQHTRLSIKIA